MRSLALAALFALPLYAQAQTDTTFSGRIRQLEGDVAILKKAAAEQRAAEAAAKKAASAAEAPVPSCEESRQQLERRFELQARLQGEPYERTLWFAYTGCLTEGRNDYLPGYTERSYAAEGGFVLTIVTDDGASASDVLLSKGKDFIGRFGRISTARLSSGEWNTLAESQTVTKGRMRGAEAQIIDLFPALKTCEASAKKNLSGQYDSRNLTLMLLTETKAYYYHEDCDICAALDACELKTGALTTVKTAHVLTCSDLAPFKGSEKVLYSCK